MTRGHRTMKICVQCSNVLSCSANILTREHGFEEKIKECHFGQNVRRLVAPAYNLIEIRKI